MLEARGDPPEVWRDRVTEARLELAGATADLKSLKVNVSPAAAPFARRLEKLQGRLAAVERAGLPHVVEDNPIRDGDQLERTVEDMEVAQGIGRERTVHVRQFLLSWTAPIRVPEQEQEVAASEFLAIP